MIAIDTNVLLRYLLEDDLKQANKAKALINGKQKVLVVDAVLVETVWVLTGNRYQLNKEQIIDTIMILFAEYNIVFEDPQVVWCALKDYRLADSIRVKGKKKQADFADALIVNKAIKYGKITGNKVDVIYTFDKAALLIDGTKEP
ncbi:MAG: PIN domain nuclease [Gammaproteobacteria bacterium]|nr:MAG: PIN domain nuclease [Gammaproteobacteria bacterium]